MNQIKELIMKFSHVFLSLLLASWFNLANSSTLPATNSASPKAAAADYQPVQGQAGKDVIWVPTPEGLIDKMLTTAKVNDQDKLFESSWYITNREFESRMETTSSNNRTNNSFCIIYCSSTIFRWKM
jgi:hypothetical protein